MLATITDILCKGGFLPADEQHPTFHIRLCSGEQLNVQVFARSGVYLHMRVKGYGVLPSEYEQCLSGWRSFPEYAPKPLGRYLKNSWEVIIFPGIAHEPVLMGDIARNKARLIEQLVGFFEASHKGLDTGRSLESHRVFLRKLRDRAVEPTVAVLAEKWASVDEVDLLPHIAQHSDFVVSNLGIRNTGLVVFDWEDYGKVTLPGFDLCTAIASDARFNLARFRTIMDGSGAGSDAYSRLVGQVCPLIGLTADMFRRLVPLYLAIFLDLKRDYGEGVRLSVRTLIQSILGMNESDASCRFMPKSAAED